MSDDRNDLSRRSFLKSAGIIGAGSVLTATSGVLAGPAATQPDAEPTSQPASTPGGHPVPRRPFGKTGVKVPILSLGGIFDIERNQLVLKQAFKWGITYWDTAYSYANGRSELGIGMYLEKEPQARKDLFLVTKSSSRNPANFDRQFNVSLERMKTDYVDLFFFHGAGSAKDVNDQAASWKVWAEKAKAAGKIKFFGFSTHSNMADCMAAAAKLGFIDGIMMKYDFRIMGQDAMKAAVEACTKAGIGLTAMKTQAGRSKQPEEDAATLPLIEQFVKKGFTDRQANLKVVWENKDIACICSQMQNLTLLTSNYLAATDKTRLSAADRAIMQEYAAATCSSYCAGCANICESAVDGRPPIADVMRFLMYRNDYGMDEYARQLFAEMPRKVRERLTRADYATAEARCPQKIAIAEMMRSAETLLA